MDQELLRFLLAAFPRPTSSLDSGDDWLVIQGYRVPSESPVADVMAGIAVERHQPRA